MIGLLQRLLGDGEDAPEPPASPEERRKLEHRRRRLRRQVQRLERDVGRMCSTCTKEQVTPRQLAASRKLDEMRAELREIQARLDAADA